DERDSRHHRCPPSDLEHTELRIALIELLGRLPPPLRILADALAVTTKAGAGRELGVHLSTVHRRCAQLRELLRSLDPTIKVTGVPPATDPLATSYTRPTGRPDQLAAHRLNRT